MMTIEDADGYLTGLTYAAQFDHPLTQGTDRVMHSLVRAKLPLLKTAKYLDSILRLLSWDQSLSKAPSPVEGRQEDEIREFLRSLALKIQSTYPWAVCSGHFAPSSGTWRCYEHPEIERAFDRGETLPLLNAVEVVWEKIPAKGSLSTTDALRSEFESYYTRECLMGAVLYSPTEPYSKASAERLKQVLSENQLAEAKNLLREVFLDKENPVVVEIVKSIKFDWFETPESTMWYQKFIHEIASNLQA